MVSQYPSWSQMSGNFQGLDIEEKVVKRSWKELQDAWNPPNPPFYPTDVWKKALFELGVIKNFDFAEMNSVLNNAFFKDSTISSLVPYTKAERLLVRISSAIKDRSCKVSDMTGETYCSLHSKVLSDCNPVEGCVLLLRNVTVLPELVLDISKDNIFRVFT